MSGFPDKFMERLTSDLGESDSQLLLRALDEQPPTSVRLHPSKPASIASSEPIPWSQDGRYLAQRPQFTLDPEFHAGAYYVQEASSQFVGWLLSKSRDAQGLRVLDTCAAPGGKSTLYASLVGEDGLVVANEIDRKRASILVDNVKKWGLGNIAVTTTKTESFAAVKGWFDVVAVDAPCSGEGMFRKDHGAREEWSPAGVASCSQMQIDILKNVWDSLRAGGLLIYSTCTFNRTENEELLEQFAQWADCELEQSEHISLGDDWGVERGSVGAFQTFRFYPHRAKGEGFFAAVAQKSEDVRLKCQLPRSKRSPLEDISRAEQKEVLSWCAEPELMHCAKIADNFYTYRKSTYSAVRELAGALPVIYSGTLMGQIFKGQLKPDPATAFWCGLRLGVVPERELDREQALSYLRRQEIDPMLFEQGVNLVTYNNMALGYVKRIGARINNLYPNSLRIQHL